MKKRTIIYVVSIVVLASAIATAFYFYQSQNNTTNKTQQTQQIVPKTSTKKDITYKGKDGVTALVLLKQTAKIETDGTGLINSIDGVTANPKNQYWELFVNNKSSSEGAGTLVTKNTDIITWKLSSF